MSAQNNQLFGFATESEDVVIRRLSRRVMRYLDLVQTLPAELRAPQQSKSVISVPPPPSPFRSPPVALEQESQLLDRTELEFADDVPTHVSFVRGDTPAVVEEDLAVPASPLPVLSSPVSHPRGSAPQPPPVPWSDFQPPPPPLRIKPKAEAPLQASHPTVSRELNFTRGSEAAVATIVAKENKKKAPPSSPVAAALNDRGARAEDEHLAESVSSRALVATLLIVSGALLLAGLVYWLLTFDKFVY